MVTFIEADDTLVSLIAVRDLGLLAGKVRPSKHQLRDLYLLSADSKSCSVVKSVLKSL